MSVHGPGQPRLRMTLFSFYRTCCSGFIFRVAAINHMQLHNLVFGETTSYSNIHKKKYCKQLWKTYCGYVMLGQERIRYILTWIWKEGRVQDYFLKISYFNIAFFFFFTISAFPRKKYRNLHLKKRKKIWHSLEDWYLRFVHFGVDLNENVDAADFKRCVTGKRLYSAAVR